MPRFFKEREMKKSVIVLLTLLVLGGYSGDYCFAENGFSPENTWVIPGLKVPKKQKQSQISRLTNKKNPNLFNTLKNKQKGTVRRPPEKSKNPMSTDILQALSDLKSKKTMASSLQPINVEESKMKASVINQIVKKEAVPPTMPSNTNRKQSSITKSSSISLGNSQKKNISTNFVVIKDEPIYSENSRLRSWERIGEDIISYKRHLFWKGILDGTLNILIFVLILSVVSYFRKKIAQIVLQFEFFPFHK